MGRCILPWEAPLDSYFTMGGGETLGTEVWYDGRVLRCHGDYSTSEYESLIFGARNHMLIEGA